METSAGFRGWPPVMHGVDPLTVTSLTSHPRNMCVHYHDIYNMCVHSFSLATPDQNIRADANADADADARESSSFATMSEAGPDPVAKRDLSVEGLALFRQASGEVTTLPQVSFRCCELDRPLNWLSQYGLGQKSPASPFDLRARCSD